MHKPAILALAVAICTDATTVKAAVTSWTDNAGNANWNALENWNNGVPGSSDDAKHTSSLSDIQMNVTTGECLSFEGDGGSPTDRFMRVDAGNTLDVGGVLKGSNSTQFKLLLQDGSSGDLTTVSVDDDLLRIAIAAARSNNADFAKIDVTDDVIDSSIVVRKDADIDVGGDMTGTAAGGHKLTVDVSGDVDIVGDLTDVAVTLGASSIGIGDSATTVDIGSVGASNATDEDWTLKGAVDVTAAGVFKVNGSTMTLSGNSTLTSGITDGGSWIVEDLAELTVTTGNNAYFTPDSLVIDGATVEADHFGFDASTVLPVWQMTIKNGGAAKTTIEGAIRLAGTGQGLSENSVLTYVGTGNSMTSRNIELGGELVSGGTGATLDIVYDDPFLVSTETVRVENGMTIITQFDTEGVTLKPIVGDDPTEVFGPDYDGHNGSSVLFTDSPCVRRWAEVTYDDSSAVDRILDDYYCSTPISGSATDLCPGGPPTGGVPEALYVIDLTVDSGATLDTNGYNVYYTGTLTNNGTIESVGSSYTPVKLTPRLYGDFNSDGDGDEPDQAGSDTRRFNDAFCTCIGDTDYDILVDWNCDGRIDDDDRDQYNTNWGDPTALTTATCGDPCP